MSKNTEQTSLEAGSIYEHFKGNKYEIISVARNGSNQSHPSDLHVVYKALYDDKEFGYGSIWIRPLEEFLEIMPNGNPRFSPVPQNHKKI